LCHDAIVFTNTPIDKGICSFLRIQRVFQKGLTLLQTLGQGRLLARLLGRGTIVNLMFDAFGTGSFKWIYSISTTLIISLRKSLGERRQGTLGFGTASCHGGKEKKVREASVAGF
jgi:hypothetical protein